MNVTQTIQKTSEQILNIVNNSGLHPSISKLILLDIIHGIEKFEALQINLEGENKKEE